MSVVAAYHIFVCALFLVQGGMWTGLWIFHYYECCCSISYLCVHCLWCREVCGLDSPHTSLHQKHRTHKYMICCHNTH